MDIRLYEAAQLFSDGADQKWFLIESVEILYYSHAKRFNMYQNY